MSEELKACPFCGCEDVEVFHITFGDLRAARAALKETGNAD